MTGLEQVSIHVDILILLCVEDVPGRLLLNLNGVKMFVLVYVLNIYGPKCHNREFLAPNAEKTPLRFWP